MNTQNDVNTQEAVWVPISQITVPADVRVHTQEDIDSRAVSMAREGQAQPILLSKEGEKLVLVYGNGRLESAKKLGWEKIRADVKEDLTETQKLMLTLAENEERENASPFYTAGLYKRIMAAEGITSEQLPERLGKSRAAVYQYLAIAKLESEVQSMSTRVDIGLKHWLEIAKLPKPEEQVKLAQECAEKDYSVRELQARVKKMLNPEAAEPKAAKATPAFEFKWEGRDLIIKVRPFHPDQEGWNDYNMALNEACSNYRIAFPLPEVKAEEVAKAA
jgi:ParB family chromosome partitioning protein